MPPKQIKQKLNISTNYGNVGYSLWASREIEDRRLYKLQHQDDDVTSCLEKRIGPIIGRRNIIKSASDRLKDKKAAEAAAQIMAKMPYERITQQLLDGIHYGYAIQCIIEWILEDALYIPKLQPIHQERITFVPIADTLTSAFGDLANPLVFGDFDLKPEEVLTEGDYEVRLRTRRSPYYGERLHKDRFVFYSYGSETGEPWGRGLAWRFAPYVEIKQRAWELWLSGRSPATLGTHPSGLTPAQEEKLLPIWRRFLESIAPEAWADVEDGFKAEMIRTGADASPETQEKMIGLCSQAVYKAGLGEVPTSMLNRGSYSANESQVNDRAAGTTDKDCDNISQCLMEQLWKPIGDLNYPTARFPLVRRWTTEDEAAIAESKAREEAKGTSIDWWSKMLTAGFAPTKENVIETFGAGWTLPGITDAGTEVSNEQALPDNAIEMGEENRKDEVYERYKAAVNMTASELEEWAKHEHSNLASLSRSPINRNLRLLTKKKEDWNAQDIRDALKTISFVSRMRKAGGKGKGTPINQKVGKSKKYIALKNWAFDMDKMASDHSESLPSYSRQFVKYAAALKNKSLPEIAKLTGIEEDLLKLAYEDGLEEWCEEDASNHQKGMAGVYRAILTW